MNPIASKKGKLTYDKFDDVEGRSIGTKGRDAKIENASEELFGLILTLRWEIRVHTCATMHRYSPTPHYNYNLSLLCDISCLVERNLVGGFIGNFGIENVYVVQLNFALG